MKTIDDAGFAGEGSTAEWQCGVIDDSILADVTGGATGDFPGFTNCGPNYFSKGCIDGGMNLEEQLAISQGARMVTGQKATFKNWANWMRQHQYPSAALDKIGWPAHGKR